MQIEIYSDVVCPWCYIGKRRLDAVLQSSAGDDVVVRWRPYQLYPDIPHAGYLREAFVLARNPGAQDVDALLSRIPSRIAAEAADVGLQFDFAAMKYMPNTKLAHRLLEFAVEPGVQHQLAEVLFRYYFCEGRDVGDREVLIEAAAELGMDPRLVRDRLAGQEGVDEVERQLNRSIELGVNGVPCILLGGAFMLPGAQTEDVIESFIVRAKQRFG
jgi:predicted DsbA family dithiol-disulfide isomerase